MRPESMGDAGSGIIGTVGNSAKYQLRIQCILFQLSRLGILGVLVSKYFLNQSNYLGIWSLGAPGREERAMPQLDHRAVSRAMSFQGHPQVGEKPSRR